MKISDIETEVMTLRVEEERHVELQDELMSMLNKFKYLESHVESIAGMCHK